MQPEKDIYTFKKGDKITRILPIVDEDGFKNFSLVGAKLTFIGIANACIYLTKKPDILASLFLGKEDLQIKLPIGLCSTGWADYIEPDFLDNSVEDSNSDIDSNDEDLDIEELEKSIQKAVDKEDFVRAAVLKKRIIDLKNKRGENFS